MKRILLIEDDTFLRTLYLDLLKKTDSEVVFAIDGEEAYKKLSEDIWDLVILDVILPKMDALEVLNKLKKNFPDKLNQKIIIMSNVVNDTMMIELRKFGFEIFDKSDINPDEFIKKVVSLIK